MELFAQTFEYSYEVNSSGSTGVFWTIMLLSLVAWVFSIIAFWRMFEKAGYAGWKSLIPFYNYYLLFEIGGMNGWMFLLMFVPVVNFIIWIVLSLNIAKAFGKSTMFAIFGLLFFSLIGYLVLGFGKAKYIGLESEE